MHVVFTANIFHNNYMHYNYVVGYQHRYCARMWPNPTVARYTASGVFLHTNGTSASFHRLFSRGSVCGWVGDRRQGTGYVMPAFANDLSTRSAAAGRNRNYPIGNCSVADTVIRAALRTGPLLISIALWSVDGFIGNAILLNNDHLFLQSRQ